MCGSQLPNAKLTGANLYGADLTGADLRGADLQRCNFRNAKLNETNLTEANVQGTRFDGSIGLSEEAKSALKNRGAILKDSRLNASDTKWWMQYIIVPLIIACLGSGGIFGIFNSLHKDNCLPSKPVVSTTHSVK